MKTHTIAFSAASVLLTSLIIVGTFKTGFVAALTATSTSATSTDAVPAISLVDTSSSTLSTFASSTVSVPVAFTTATSTSAEPATARATSTVIAASATSSVSQAKGKPALKLVHVVGSKYIDLFTDGTTIFSFPGDPLIDAALNKPNAPIPTHAGLTWVSSKAMEAYDTASGDLEPGTFAQEVDGSFIVNTSDASIAETPSSNAHVAFSKLDPTIDASAASPDSKATEASVSHSRAHLSAADTASTTSPLPDTSTSASSTPEASTTTSASSTAVVSVASTTPNIASATGTATSTASSSAASSAASNDTSASTTTATSTAR